MKRILSGILVFFASAGLCFADDLAAGKAAASAKNYDEAISCFSRYMQSHKNDLECYRLLGYAYARKGSWDAALKSLNDGLSINPSDINTLYARASINSMKFLNLKFGARAVLIISGRVNYNNPVHDPLWIDSSTKEGAELLGALNASIGDCEKCMAAVPDNPRLNELYGKMLWEKNRLADCISPLTRVIGSWKTAGERDPDILSRRGDGYYSSGRKTEALADYQAAVDAGKGDDSEVYYRIGSILNSEKKRPEALAAAERAIALDGKNPEHYMLRAAIRAGMGDEAGSRADMKMYRKLMK